MSYTTIGIRELKAQLSRTMRQVKAGETVIITERGEPIGRIVPMPTALEDRLQELVELGLVAWNGQKFGARPRDFTPARVKGPVTVADLLLEDRE